MDSTAQKKVILETLDSAIALLPQAIRATVASHPQDPRPLKKKGTDILRLRVLPTTKNPPKFWSSSWCFYEIGVGMYDPVTAGGLNVGGISFLQFPSNKQCGSGTYLAPVTRILNQLLKQRPDFQLTIPTGKDDAALSFQRRYRIKEFPAFPVQTAAQDLAWLISESLTRFQTLIYSF